MVSEARRLMAEVKAIRLRAAAKIFIFDSV